MPTVGPVQQQVYVDVVLGQISIAYQNESYIADTIFPEIQVQKRTGVYFVYDKSKFNVVNDHRAPGTRAQQVEFGVTQTAYGPLLEHALEQGIQWEVRDEAVAPLDLEVDATNNVTDRLMLSKEVDAFNQCSNTSTVTQNVTLSGTSRWDDYANSDPIADVRTAVDTVKKATLKPANQLTLVLGYEAFSILKNHPQIVERVKYSQLGVLNTDLLAQVFGVKQVLIAEAEYNTANQFQTASMSYVWGKNAWVMYINDRPALRQVSFGYTLRMGARTVTKWSEQQVKTDYVRVEDYYQQLIVAPVAGYYMASVVN